LPYWPVKSFAGDYRQKVYQVRLPAQPGTMAAVLYPRNHDQPVPQITPWANNSGAKLVIGNETHYVILTDAPGVIRADGQTSVGRAGVIRLRAGVVTLTLLSGTEIGSGDFLLHSAGIDGKAVPGSLSMTRNLTGVIAGESHGDARTVTFQVPASLKPITLHVDGKPANIDTAEGHLRLSLPAGDHTFSLQ
jgi:hypothetical protein